MAMQHRSNPILNTLEEVPGLPIKVKLCKIPASPFYYVRTWIDGKPILRSMKTEKQGEARKAARAFYDELLLKKAKGQPLTEGGHFKKVFDDLQKTDKARVDRGDRKDSLTKDSAYIFNKDLLPFFGKDQLKAIDFKRITEYVAHVEARGISGKTVKNHLIVLSKMLKHAHKLNLLDRLPIFPTIEVKDNPREWFTEQQYERLKVVIVQEVKAGTVVNRHPITNELLYLTIFMANAFLRPSDIKHLQTKHIMMYEEPDKYLLIRAKSKVKTGESVTMPIAVDVYKRLTAMNTKLGFGKPDDYVFFPGLSRSYAMQTMQRQFKYVLVKYGMKTGVDGAPRTLYSLRHTCICLRILKSDMSIKTLADNCRTSVPMIERFYGRHLESQKRVKEIQSLKPGKRGQGVLKKIKGYQPD
jgi:integrase